MALSQKHSGLMLVPWFNSHEWRYVYRLLYESTDVNNRKRAQTILQVWKDRTPKLPSAVEGTLIILNALLLDDDISYENKRLSIGASIMRFLNLCCCQGDKQGTFASSAKAYNIPEWIINIRHDVAHDATLPSSEILALALDFCFDWLRTNYWEAQDSILHDHLVYDDNKNLQNIQTAMSLYCQINTLYYFNKDALIRVKDIKTLDGNLFRDIIEFLNEVELKNSTSVHLASSLLLEYIAKKSSEMNKTKLTCSIVDTAINDGGLLTLNNEKCFNVNLDVAIELPNDFVDVWTNLIDFILTMNMLQTFFNKLLDIVNNVVCDGLLRKVASLWLSHILQRFLLTQVLHMNPSKQEGAKSIYKKFPNLKNLSPFVYCDSNEIFKIVSVLPPLFINNPNKYTLQFLDCFLEVYERSKKSANFKENKNRTRLSPESKNGNVTTNITTLNCHNSSKDQDTTEVVRKNCFQPVTDYSIFEECPLGVLRGQNRDINPWLFHEFGLDY